MANKPERALSSEQMREMMRELEELEKEIESSQARLLSADAGTDQTSSSEPSLGVQVRPEDFFGKRGETPASESMEESLGHLKHEEPAHRNSLFDRAPPPSEAEPSVMESREPKVQAEELAEESVSDVSPVARPAFRRDPHAEGSSSAPNALKLSLKGEMTLDLEYEAGGSIVVVSFADGFLQVTLADGAEFKIPLPASKTAKLRSIA